MRVNTFVSIQQSVADMMCTSQKGCVGFEHASAINYKYIIFINKLIFSEKLWYTTLLTKVDIPNSV